MFSRNKIVSIITESIISALTERADVVVYNGNKHLTNAMTGAYPFFYNTTNGQLIVGNEGETHYDAMERGAFTEPEPDDFSEDEIDSGFKNIIMGRYWQKQNVMGFWRVQPSGDVVRKITQGLSENHLLTDVQSLQIVVDCEKHREGWALLDHYLVPYSNYIQGNLESMYQDSEEFKKQYALHLADMGTKRDKMQGFLRNRSQNLGKKLGTKDGEMSQAEWNALHRTSESKH